jgi:hypothetical protein
MEFIPGNDNQMSDPNWPAILTGYLLAAQPRPRAGISIALPARKSLPGQREQ